MTWMANFVLTDGTVGVSYAHHFHGAVVKPNAQVQGRALGEAEARSGGGVPCNAQLGAVSSLQGLLDDLATSFNFEDLLIGECAAALVQLAASEPRI